MICITVSPIPRKQAVHIARNNAVKAKAKQEEAYSRGYAYSFVGEEITKLAKRAERLRKEIVLEGNNLCKERNYNKRLWVYFEDINSWVRNSRANAALLLSLWKRSRVHCGIITLCSTDYDSLINSEYGQSLICNTGFFLFLNQSETSRETIRKLHNFHEGEMEYLDGSLSTGLLFNNQSVIPLECRWDLDD